MRTRDLSDNALGTSAVVGLSPVALEYDDGEGDLVWAKL
jgi:hypothetical protein